jgi:LytR cell envelope-related transcriptional attenuator/LytR_cpsA_psr family
VSLGPGDGRVQPSRADRTGASIRRRRIYAIVVLLVIAASGVVAMQLDGGAGGAAANSPSASGASPAASTPTDLLAFSVTGAPKALLAVVGTGSEQPPAGLILPPGMTVVVPGQGETVTEDVQALPGDSMRVGVSNTVGTWADHFAVIDLRDFGRAIDDLGGLSVNLPDAYPVGGTVLGPGKTHMNGNQVVALLSEDADDVDLRWASVLEAYLGAAPQLPQDAFAETDNAAAAASILGGAAGAEVQVAPTEVVGGTAIVVKQPDLDDLVGRVFGTPEPIPALVQNGTGRPSVGEAVAHDLLPAGFRIVLSENASSFDHPSTTITANGEAHIDDANAAKRALGVGDVRVSQVPSGLADVTIVVGRDFEG